MMSYAIFTASIFLVYNCLLKKQQRCSQQSFEICKDLLGDVLLEHTQPIIYFISNLQSKNKTFNPLRPEHFLKITKYLMKKKWICELFGDVWMKSRRHLWHFCGACFFKI